MLVPDRKKARGDGPASQWDRRRDIWDMVMDSDEDIQGKQVLNLIFNMPFI
jgi:hypothetical protein